ncbi:RpiR family transcriptional regulator [Bacillus canaveralius]|uniref:RpiR family transcriptional regulator n=1 Tax=Bacillus canaveralius TaxID=1403243 RepID=A0A2N5GFV0_9BACI|nr:MurR/RpiR family transcriptional regulator [Bacillus canaveralius]PLR79580.1 RpiR family transcriptional regulator [Bacillus canaveralius]PLR98290.1 RpiR family transcriptional regulator [Bacillus canaveralius]RSK53239.1 MurR/RpiR family transcriptional regulator [Bacillus canaveralius]
MFSNEVISTFNELEFSLYNYVTNNIDKVVYMRIRDLAKETHVSTSTILRFCRKLNCEGFSEFKVKLKLLLDKDERTSLRRSQDSLLEFMERTLKGNLDSYITEAAEVISHSDSVIFIGIGSSGILAEYGARYFSSLEKFSLYIKDPHFPITTNYLHNSTTIALSVSGENRFTITHIHQLKQEGSKIISITNSQHCTVAKISDINIPYYVTEEKYHTSNITTQIPVVYILESIARKVNKLTKRK